jgi:hypothetical protein
MKFAHATRAAQIPAPFTDTTPIDAPPCGDTPEMAHPFVTTGGCMAQPEELDVMLLYLRGELLHALLQAVQKAVGVRND